MHTHHPHRHIVRIRNSELAVGTNKLDKHSAYVMKK